MHFVMRIFASCVIFSIYWGCDRGGRLDRLSRDDPEKPNPDLRHHILRRMIFKSLKINKKFSEIARTYDSDSTNISIVSSSRFLKKGTRRSFWVVGPVPKRTTCLKLLYFEIYDSPKPTNWLNSFENIPKPQSPFAPITQSTTKPYWCDDKVTEIDRFAFNLYLSGDLEQSEPLNYVRISSTCCKLGDCEEPVGELFVTERDTQPPSIKEDVINWSLYSGLRDGSVRSKWISATELSFEIPETVVYYFRRIFLHGWQSCNYKRLCATETYPQDNEDSIYIRLAFHEKAGECPQIRMIIAYHDFEEKFSWLSDIDHFNVPLNWEFQPIANMPECPKHAPACMVWDIATCARMGEGRLTWNKKEEDN